MSLYAKYAKERTMKNSQTGGYSIIIVLVRADLLLAFFGRWIPPENAQDKAF